MSGQSSSTQTQQSQTAPWEAAQPILQGILGQLGTGLNNTGLTGQETGAINTLEQNAGSASQFAPQIADYAKQLLSGGGATDQSGNINANYQRYVDQTNPLASNTNYDPRQTPGLAEALAQIQTDVGNNVNGQFAAAGRDFSGANQMAYGRGVAAGEAPVIAAQKMVSSPASFGRASSR